ncbi:MAG TPA: hypothetical protein VKU01_02615 [Bryobacteraceae bacterium]|nr:hypothetical protein [Bryobacteraceae bacterium]
MLYRVLGTAELVNAPSGVAESKIPKPVPNNESIEPVIAGLDGLIHKAILVECGGLEFSLTIEDVSEHARLNLPGTPASES